MSLFESVNSYFAKIPLAYISTCSTARESTECKSSLSGTPSSSIVLSVQGDANAPTGKKHVEVTIQSNTPEFPLPLLTSMAWWIQRPRADPLVTSVHVRCTLKGGIVFPSLPFRSSCSRLPFSSLLVQTASVVMPIEVQWNEVDLENLEALDLRNCKQVRGMGNTLLHATHLRSLKLPVIGEEESIWLEKLSGLEVLHVTAAHWCVLDAMSGLTQLREVELAVTVTVKDGNKKLCIPTNHLVSLTVKGPFCDSVDFLANSPHLQLLNLNGCSVSDLSPLTSCPRFQRLYIQSCDQLLSLKSFFEAKETNRILSSLVELDVTFSPLTDMSGIGGCLALQSLRLAQCRKITTFLPLQGNQSITKLVLVGCGVQDWSPLSTCSGLRCLHCGGAQFTNCEAIGTIRTLTELHLTGAPIDHLDPLSHLQDLQVLEVSSCTKLKSIRPLHTSHKLEELNLGYSGVENLDGLEGCSHLRKLRISFCKNVTSFSPLKGLVELREILAVRTGVTDLVVLSHCTSLVLLDLTQCKQLLSLSGVETLSNLEKLLLGDCILLSDVSPLKHCRSLSFLNLTNCDQIKDLSPLFLLPNLHQIYGKPEFKKV